MTHADVYARQSQDRDKTGLATGRQVEDAERLCEIRGWPIAETFIDDDTSAAGLKKRPAFEKLLAKIKDGRVEVVVAWSLDRITRNRRDTVRFIEACQDNSVMVALVRGSDMDLSTPSGRLMADMLSGIARHEIEVKSDRQRRAHEQSAKAGRPPMRRCFGYNKDGTKHPDEAAAVQEVFARFLATGSVNSATTWLNDNGFHTARCICLDCAPDAEQPPGVSDDAWEQRRQPKPWDRASIRKLLRNVRYAGIRVHRGIEVGRGKWDQLVDEDTVRDATALLADPARRKTRSTARKWLGSRLYLCGRCDDGTTVATNYDHGLDRIYRCDVCFMTRKAEPIDAKVLGLIRARLARPDVADVLAGPDIDIAGLRTQRRAVQLRLDGLADNLELDERTLARRSRALRDRLGAIEARLGEAAAASPVEALLGAEDPVAAFDAMDVVGKQRVIDFFCTVTLYPGRGAAVDVAPK